MKVSFNLYMVRVWQDCHADFLFIYLFIQYLNGRKFCDVHILLIDYLYVMKYLFMINYILLNKSYCLFSTISISLHMFLNTCSPYSYQINTHYADSFINAFKLTLPEDFHDLLRRVWGKTGIFSFIGYYASEFCYSIYFNKKYKGIFILQLSF